MVAERFFVDAELEEGTTVAIEGVELHHLAHVMRVRVGDEVEMVNGRGFLAKARVAAIGKREAQIEVLSSFHRPSFSSHVLAIPLMRPSKLEWIVEKGTELGAAAFWFYPAEYSEKEGLSDNQRERLKQIVISAMKQCGRLDLPQIVLKNSFEDVFEGEGPFFYGDLREQAEPLKHQKCAVFISGPEKGFSQREFTFMSKRAKGVKLHRNILRAETAPMVALVLLDN